MPKFTNIRRGNRRDPAEEGNEKPRPFPTLSTFLGMAAVLLVLWLLATGLPHLLPKTEHPAPSNTIDTGAQK